MQKQQILVSWIGKTDIKQAGSAEQPGPLENILKQCAYDKTYILHNQSTGEVEKYLSILNKCTDTLIIEKQIELNDPTDFEDIYHIVDPLLSKIMEEHKGGDITLQITSGTPSMTAVSILLGKAKFDTKFIKSTEENGVQEPIIPFEIMADYVPSKKERTNELTNLFAGEAPDTAAFTDIVTQSPEMEVLKQKAAIIAQRDLPVLIYGETGTGKELFANAIHNASGRSDKKMLVLNCGAIAKELINSTLFGHEKGAFTGAVSAQPGYFEQANGSTLFLDEFGELPLDSQVHLLRVLQDGKFSRVGSTKELTSDVRIIAATNKDLVKEISKGNFREDLFYRVAIGVLQLPPISQRSGDLTLLANTLLGKINEKAGANTDQKHKHFSASAIKFITNYHWPGNVRELNATILRATLWQQGEVISEKDVSEALILKEDTKDSIFDRDISQGIDINDIFSEIARHYISKAMNLCNENKTKAANMLGLKNYQTLNNWIEKYNIN